MRLIVALAVGWVLTASLASAEPVSDPHVRAAYTINFLRYSSWPTTAAESKPYILTVVGSAAEAAAMREIADRAGEVQGRRIEVAAIRLIGEDSQWTSGGATDAELRRSLGTSHLVYVAPSHRRLAERVLAAVGADVLTVGNGKQFARLGGMVSLWLEEGRIVFHVNAEAVARSGVVLSAKVHQLSRPVVSAEEP